MFHQENTIGSLEIGETGSVQGRTLFAKQDCTSFIKVSSEAHEQLDGKSKRYKRKIYDEDALRLPIYATYVVGIYLRQ